MRDKRGILGPHAGYEKLRIYSVTAVIYDPTVVVGVF